MNLKLLYKFNYSILVRDQMIWASIFVQAVLQQEHKMCFSLFYKTRQKGNEMNHREKKSISKIV